MRGIDPNAGQRCSNLWIYLHIPSEMAHIKLDWYDYSLLLPLITKKLYLIILYLSATVLF